MIDKSCFWIRRLFPAKCLAVVGLLSGVAPSEPIWLVSPAIGIGAMKFGREETGEVCLSFSLDAKRRLEGSTWIGLNASKQGFLTFASALNSPHEFYTLNPTYSRIWMAKYGHIGATTGLGVWVLRWNANRTTCYGESWVLGGTDSELDCADQPRPPDRWETHAGLMMPLALQFGLH